MPASGKFDVNLLPQKDDRAPVGRMIIKKKYHGSMEGAGVGQMISKRTDDGVAVYFAIEEFSGVLDGKHGSFTLMHQGFMDNESQVLKVDVLRGSGRRELKNITGTMEISKDGDDHTYELNYEL